MSVGVALCRGSCKLIDSGSINYRNFRRESRVGDTSGGCEGNRLGVQESMPKPSRHKRSVNFSFVSIPNPEWDVRTSDFWKKRRQEKRTSPYWTWLGNSLNVTGHDRWHIEEYRNPNHCLYHCCSTSFFDRSTRRGVLDGSRNHYDKEYISY